MENTTLQFEELDIVADAFMEAVELIGLDVAVIDSPEIELLRGVVVFLAQQLRRQVLTIDSDDVTCIAYEAEMLFEIVRPRS